jgi:hypothetical protein
MWPLVMAHSGACCLYPARATEGASVPTPAILPYPNYQQHDDLGGRSTRAKKQTQLEGRKEKI